MEILCRNEVYFHEVRFTLPVLVKKTELKYEKQYLYNETTEHPMRGSAERRSHER